MPASQAQLLLGAGDSNFSASAQYSVAWPWILKAQGGSSFVGTPTYQAGSAPSAGAGDVSVTVNLPSTPNYLILLDQNWSSAGNLLVTQVSDPQDYILYVFQSSDWVANRRDAGYAMGSSRLDTQGNWYQQVAVTPGTYHIVLLSSTETIVAWPYLSAQPATVQGQSVYVSGLGAGSGLLTAW